MRIIKDIAKIIRDGLLENLGMGEIDIVKEEYLSQTGGNENSFYNVALDEANRWDRLYKNPELISEYKKDKFIIILILYLVNENKYSNEEVQLLKSFLL